MTGSFVGRERHVDRLVAAARAAGDGRGSLLLVTGEPGIGKTRLAEEVALRASRAGSEVLWSTCWEDGAPAYLPWALLLRRLAEGRGVDNLFGEASASGRAVLRLVPELVSTTIEDRGGPAIAGIDGAPGLDKARFELFEEVTSVLRRAAAVRPLLVVADDLHWADAPSLLLLRFAARSLRHGRVLFLGLYRDVEVDRGTERGRLLAELAEEGSVLGLSGLSEDEVARLISGAAGSRPTSEVASMVHRHSGGNPLFVLELARLLADQGKLTNPAQLRTLAIPLGARAVLERRLARLSPPCFAALATASVIGSEFSLDVLAETTGEPREELAGLLEGAVRARLLDTSPVPGGPFRFAHALVREALYAQVPPGRRAGLHRAVGHALEAVDPERHLAELAHHFLLAGEGVDRDRAVEYGERAGRRALDLLAYEEAARHFGRSLAALRLGEETGERRVELLLALGDARLRAGDLPAAREAFEEATDEARRRRRPDELARAALGFGAGLAGFEVRLFDRRQLDLLEEALAGLDPREGRLRTWVLARLSVALSLVASSERRRALAEEAVTLARRLDDPAALAHALASHCDAIAGPAHAEVRRTEAEEIVRLARATGAPGLELLGRRLGVVARLELADMAGVDAEIDAFARLAGELRQPLYLWYVPHWRSMRALMEGRLDHAERLAAEAAEIGRRAHSDNAIVLVGSLRLSLALERGLPAEAERLLRSMLDERLPLGASAQAWLAGILAQADRPAEARALLDRLAASGFTELSLDDGQSLAALCQAGLACALLGAVEAAEVLLPILLPHSDRFAVDGIASDCLGSVSRFLGLLARTLGRGEEARRHFEMALLAHRRAGSALLVAHTLCQYGASLLAEGSEPERLRGRELLEEAAATYRELGLPHHVEATERTRATTSTARGGPVAVADGPTSPGTDNVFRRQGELWTVVFAGVTTHLKDTKGLRDLARLLGCPGEEVHVADLVAATTPRPTRRAPEDSEHGPGDAGPVLDDVAKNRYKARLVELEEAIGEAEGDHDLARLELARAERDYLVAELAAAYGLGGRPRRAGDPGERARSTVAWRIRDALTRIERVHPALGRHLRHSVRTGLFCVYRPEHPTTWIL